MSRYIVALFVVSVWFLSTTTAHAEAQRHFTFQYSFEVDYVAPGKSLAVWVPLAHSSRYQKVKVVLIVSDLPLTEKAQPSDGNELLYGSIAAATKAQYRFIVKYDVTRLERVMLVNGKPAGGAVEKVSATELDRALQPDQLVPITGTPAQIATKVTQGEATELSKAHAIYEYVLHNMSYDKTGTGWGRGDAIYACDIKRGNCTDFHSLFIAMARSQKIPARFEMGFPLPGNAHGGKIDGYHCWADFYVQGVGWVPVDISEAWKHPDKRDYFFGATDANRLQFTVGRDLRLEPPQSGSPLNYFVYPYVEVGGQKYAGVTQNFSFTDLGVGSTLVVAAAKTN